MERISKENYYLDIAETVIGRATCLRRCYGAIIVKNDEIIATGYNGAPRGRKNCVDLGYCAREALKVPRGERLRRPAGHGGGHFVSGGEGRRHRPDSPRRHLLLHVPPPHHQRRPQPGHHPHLPHGVSGGGGIQLGGGGRLPAPGPAVL